MLLETESVDLQKLSGNILDTARDLIIDYGYADQGTYHAANALEQLAKFVSKKHIFKKKKLKILGIF